MHSLYMLCSIPLSRMQYIHSITILDANGDVWVAKLMEDKTHIIITLEIFTVMAVVCDVAHDSGSILLFFKVTIGYGAICNHFSRVRIC